MFKIDIEQEDGKFRAVFNTRNGVEDIVETTNKEAMINMVTQILKDRVVEYKTVTDPSEALRMLCVTDMRSFTKDDWHAFAGCETKDPLISTDGEFEIVVDGDNINIIHGTDNFGGTSFKLVRV
jgi:hypothetical protein